jgi:hypothetical protein
VQGALLNVVSHKGIAPGRNFSVVSPVTLFEE